MSPCGTDIIKPNKATATVENKGAKEFIKIAAMILNTSGYYCQGEKFIPNLMKEKQSPDKKL